MFELNAATRLRTEVTAGWETNNSQNNWVKKLQGMLSKQCQNLKFSGVELDEDEEDTVRVAMFTADNFSIGSAMAKADAKLDVALKMEEVGLKFECKGGKLFIVATCYQ